MDSSTQTHLLRLQHVIKTAPVLVDNVSEFKNQVSEVVAGLANDSMRDILSHPLEAVGILADSTLYLLPESQGIYGTDYDEHEELENRSRELMDDGLTAKSSPRGGVIGELETGNDDIVDLSGERRAGNDFNLLVAKCNGNEDFAKSLLESVGNNVQDALNLLQ